MQFLQKHHFKTNYAAISYKLLEKESTLSLDSHLRKWRQRQLSPVSSADWNTAEEQQFK